MDRPCHNDSNKIHLVPSWMVMLDRGGIVDLFESFKYLCNDTEDLEYVCHWKFLLGTFLHKQSGTTILCANTCVPYLLVHDMLWNQCIWVLRN
jgi:hypothetical protein